jgi:diacylglycerol kinase (ATP)
MPGIGIVTNPNSRRNRRHPEQMQRLGFILGRDHRRHEMTRSPEDVYEVARRFLDERVDILALNGGDGTNHVTLTTFIEVYGAQPLPKIAFLRGGTMNTIANSIGIRGTPGDILLNITEKYHLAQPFETSSRHILGVRADDQTHYGFIFGNGLAANFLRAYYDTGNPTPWTAFTTMMKTISSALTRGEFAQDLFRRFEATVTLDGQPWPATSFTTILASSIEQFGLGFRPTYRCRERPGAFHALGFTIGMADVAFVLPRVRLGQPLDPKKVLSDVCASMKIESDRPITYALDGDIHTTEGNSMEVFAGPSLEVIVQ